VTTVHPLARQAALRDGIAEAEFDALLEEIDVRCREGQFLAVGMYVVVVENG
jgi:hypothetical protein